MMNIYEIASGYESDDVVEKWLSRYETEKERCFIQYINEFIPNNLNEFLEVGCGIGLHAKLWSEMGKNVTASDYSMAFCNYIKKTYTFKIIHDDVLNTKIDRKFEIVFSMGVSTIVREEKLRIQTFRVFNRYLIENGFLILSTTSNQSLLRFFGTKDNLHLLDKRDCQLLKLLGFRIVKIVYWGVTPRSLWHNPMLKKAGELLEYIGRFPFLGIRKVVICQKITGISSEKEVTLY